MNNIRVCFFVVSILTAICMSYTLPERAWAKAPRPRALAYAPPPVTPAQWFEKFDAIQTEALLSERERRGGALLVLRALAGVSQPREDEAAEEMLINISKRYEQCARKTETLAKTSATEPLQNGYTDYFRGMARLCLDCAALRAVDVASGKKKFRRLSGAEVELLTERKHTLDELLQTCQLADRMQRVKFKYPNWTPP